MTTPQDNDDKHILLFYCRDCEATFESEPDGTGYEQAPCPECGEICMTVEFEREEQKRQRGSALLFSVVGSFLGLPSIPVPNGSRSPASLPREEQDSPPSICDAATVRKVGNSAEADLCRSLLEHFGIQARSVQVDRVDPFSPGVFGEILLQVPSSDVERARQILEAYDAAQEEEQEPSQDTDPITFDCEECGREITFPGHRRGGVEICPHCNEYVDVPEG